MKIRLLFFLSGLTIAYAVQGQGTPTKQTPTPSTKQGSMPRQILFGPVAGVNVSWVSFDDKDYRDTFNVSPMIGFHAGVDLSFRVRNRFYLHSSLVYSQKGKVVKSDLDPLMDHKVRYHYIELPIIYTVEFKGQIRSKEYRWYMGVGPNISYWLGGKGTLSNSNLEEKVIFELDYKVAFKKDPIDIAPDEMIVREPNRMQLGLNLASGIVFEPAPYQKFLLMVRYEFGHSFLSRTTDGVFAPIFDKDPMRVRNQGFRISLTYLMDLRVEQRKKGKSTIKKKLK